MSNPINSNTPPQKPNPLFSNPLSDKNKSLIQRIILLIGLILLHIITLGLILLYFLAKDKISSCCKDENIQEMALPPPRPSPTAPREQLPPVHPEIPRVADETPAPPPAQAPDIKDTVPPPPRPSLEAPREQLPPVHPEIPRVADETPAPPPAQAPDIKDTVPRPSRPSPTAPREQLPLVHPEIPRVVDETPTPPPAQAPDIKDTVPPPPRPSPEAPREQLPPAPPQSPQAQGKTEQPFFRKSPKNLLELVRYYSTKPHKIPKNTLRMTAEGHQNPNFKFSLPQSVLKFFKTEYPPLFDETSVPSHSLERTRKHYIQQQINYLDTKYYLVDIRGDGNCFYRSIGISWLFSLVNQVPNNPQIFQTAMQLVSSQADFINSSQTNQQLTQNFLQLLTDLQQNASAETLIKILTQTENEAKMTAYMKAISVFYARRDRAAITQDLLLTLITDNVSLFASIVEVVQNEPSLRDCLLNFSQPQKTIINLMSETVNCPLINSPSMDVIVSPVLNTLVNFLDSQEVETAGQQAIDNHILTHPYLKPLWLFFLSKPTVQNITTPSVQLLLFINYYNLTSLTQLSIAERQAFKAFLDQVKVSALNTETTCSEELLSSLNISNQDISRAGQHALFNSTVRSCLQEILSSIDLLHCSDSSRQTVSAIHKQICSQLSFSMKYSVQEELQKLLKDKKFSEELNKFLKKPLIKKMSDDYQFTYTEENRLPHLPLELLLLFLNSHKFLVDNILAITPESAFPMKATLLEYQVLLQSMDWGTNKNEISTFMEEIFRTPISTTQNPIILTEQQALLKRLLRQPEVKSLIEKNLSTIDQVTLDNIYSTTTADTDAQAETDNVEAMRHFLPFGLVQYVKELTTEIQMQQHMATHGFSAQFPESQPLTVMRFDNHYAALIKKTN